MSTVAPSLISLIIATYNRGPCIAETLDSVLRQSLAVDEILVIDDCSPDHTGDWIRENYPSIRVVRRNTNGGTSASRNTGAKQARNNWLIFLDHDDLLLPDAVKTLVSLRDRFPEARACFTDHAYENRVTGRRTQNHHTEQPAFRRLRRVPAIRAAAGEALYGSALYRALLRGNLLQQPWMIQRETFLALGGFAEDIRYCEDWELYQRLTRDYAVALSDAVISEHIVEGTNLHLSDKQSPYHMEVLRRRLRETPRFNWYERWLLSWKLSTYHKMAADRLVTESPTGWWTENLRSFWYWPLDHVVAARALVLGPIASLPRNRRLKSKTEIRDDLASAIATAKESLATSRRDLIVPEKGFPNDPNGL